MASYRKRTDRPDKPHQVRWYKPDGTPDSASFATRREAMACMSTIEEGLRTGTFVDFDRGKLTLTQWWAIWWPTTINLSGGTRDQNLAYWRAYIQPTLGRTPLAKLSWTTIQAWVNELTAHGGKERTGLAPSTVSKALQILSKMLDKAIRDGRLATNPCDDVTVARDEDEEARFLDSDELLALEAAMEAHWRDFVPFVADVGLRIGEASATRYRDIDFVRLEVTVREGRKKVTKAVSGAETGMVLGAVKSRAGRRVVPMLTREVADRIQERQRRTGAGPDDFVFTGVRGGLLVPDNFRARVWRPAIKLAGLADPQPTPHALRHTAVARWIAAGVLDKFELRSYAGHRSIDTIDRIYGHLLPRDASRARDAMSAMRAAAQAAAEERQGTADIIQLDTRRR